MPTGQPLDAFQIFFPNAAKKLRDAIERNQRFSHYTTADTAMKIVRNKEIWLRKSLLMNDYSEVEYGLHCLMSALKKNREAFCKIFDDMFPEFSAKLTTRLDQWLPVFRSDTFITCISEHLSSEDSHGRLSMWRAYGGQNGVAFVFNGGPLLRPSNALRAYSSPVAYLSVAQFDEEFIAVLASVETNKEFVRKLGEEAVFINMFAAFRSAILCTKHPGFHEEREWRVIYSPNFALSERIAQSVESVAGVPQLVCKIPFQDVPEEGLFGMTMADAVDRIIVGPTKYPMGIKDAFDILLSEAGVTNATAKVVVSDVPLRQ